MQKHVNLVDLVKSFPTNIFLQNLASIQKRTSLVKFYHLDENQSKVRYRTFQLRSALHQAVHADDAEAVRDLLRIGASLHAKTKDGKTPRDLATDAAVAAALDAAARAGPAAKVALDARR